MAGRRKAQETKTTEFAGYQIRMDPVKHTYYVNGPDTHGEWVWVPSVTQITRVYAGGGKVNRIMAWALKLMESYLKDHWLPGKTYTSPMIRECLKDGKRQHKEVLESSSELGTAAHNWVEAFLGGGKRKRVTGPIRGAVTSFQEWYEDQDMETWGVEQMVYNPDLHFCGTYDWWGRLMESATLIDFKTSNSFREEYWLQMAAYQTTLERYAEDLDPDRGLILMLDKSGGPATPYESADPQADWEAFVCCRQLHDWGMKK